jgi:hypothetical protein
MIIDFPIVECIGMVQGFACPYYTADQCAECGAAWCKRCRADSLLCPMCELDRASRAKYRLAHINPALSNLMVRLVLLDPVRMQEDTLPVAACRKK